MLLNRRILLKDVYNVPLETKLEIKQEVIKQEVIKQLETKSEVIKQEVDIKQEDNIINPSNKTLSRRKRLNQILNKMSNR